MKKILPFILTLSAAGFLASCGSVDDTEFFEAIDSTLVFAPGDVLPGLAGGSITDDNTPSSGNAIKVVRKLTLDSGKIAEIKWDFSESEDMIYDVSAWDATHDLVEIKFGTSIQYFNFTLESVTIDKTTKKIADLNKLYAAEYGDETLDYQIVCNPAQYVYEPKPLSYFDELNAAGTGYECIDYTLDSPYFKTVNGQKKADVITKGKVVYVAPDYDFALLADGTHYMNVFMGSARNSAENDFPALRVGKYIEIRGYVDQYNGSFQLTIINRIRELKDHSDIAEPAPVSELTEAKIAELTLAADKQNFVVGNFMNTLKKVTGTYVPGSLMREGKTAATSIEANVRYTFKMQVGAQVQKISFDYHTSTGIDSQIVANLNKVFQGGSHTISGTVRYEGKSITETKGNGSGVWTIVPLNASDVA